MTLLAEPAAAPTPEGSTARRWPTLLVGFGIGVAAAVAVVASWPSGQHGGDWDSAEAMADAIGCSDSFVAYEWVDEGQGTAGHCEVLGARVLLRTFTSPEAHTAWSEGVTSADPGMSVSVTGDGYTAFTTTYDREIMSVIGPALTPGPN